MPPHDSLLCYGLHASSRCLQARRQPCLSPGIITGAASPLLTVFAPPLAMRLHGSPSPSSAPRRRGSATPSVARLVGYCAPATEASSAGLVRIKHYKIGGWPVSGWACQSSGCACHPCRNALWASANAGHPSDVFPLSRPQRFDLPQAGHRKSPSPSRSCGTPVPSAPVRGSPHRSARCGTCFETGG